MLVFFSRVNLKQMRFLTFLFPGYFSNKFSSFQKLGTALASDSVQRPSLCDLSLSEEFIASENQDFFEIISLDGDYFDQNRKQLSKIFNMDFSRKNPPFQTRSKTTTNFICQRRCDFVIVRRQIQLSMVYDRTGSPINFWEIQTFIQMFRKTLVSDLLCLRRKHRNKKRIWTEEEWQTL